MPVPFFKISVNGQDITSRISGRGISLTITDEVGLNADNLQLEIDDPGAKVSPPKKGVKINAIGGYVGRERNFGTFIVDQVSYRGYPDIISISAQSLDAMSAAKQSRPKAYSSEKYPTAGKIFEDVAGRIGVSPAISPDIAAKPNAYVAQTEEGEIEFLTRLGAMFDAAVTIKSGRLVVVPKGQGKSASGEKLPQIIVEPGLNLISYTATGFDRPKFGSVEATWFDRGKVERTVVTVATATEGPAFLIREPFQSEADANEAAAAKMKELSRAEASASFEIDGDPFSRAEALVKVGKVRTDVDGMWRAKSVTHKFSSGGPYTTSLQCEFPS